MSDGSVYVLFIFSIQLAVIHLKVRADGSPTLEFVSISIFCDYLTEGVQGYAEQHIILVYVQLMATCVNCLEVIF